MLNKWDATLKGPPYASNAVKNWKMKAFDYLLASSWENHSLFPPFLFEILKKIKIGKSEKSQPFGM